MQIDSQLLLSPQAGRLTRSSARSHSLILRIGEPYFWSELPPELDYGNELTLGYAHTSRLLRSGELGQSRLMDEPFFCMNGGLGLLATLQRSDGKVFDVKSRSRRCLYLVLLGGKLQMMLIRDVFSRTFVGYLCFPYTEKHLTVVNTELQQRSLSIIVGRIHYSTYVGFEGRDLSAHFADGELVPPLQGADNVTFSDDSIGSYESSSPDIGSI